MNTLIKIQPCLSVVIILLLVCLKSSAQTSANCNLTIGANNYPVTASVPVNSLTGLDFNLSITLPGLSNCNGNYDVSITTSNNLLYVTGVPQPFGGPPPTYTNLSIIPNNIGRNLIVVFKFKPGETCNGEKGIFNITIKTTCGGQLVSCNLLVQLTAVAQNYWTVDKKHLWGNLKGGYMLWKITLKNSHSPLGIGDYNIASGTIKDIINCDKIVSVSTSYPGTLNGLTGLFTSGTSWSTGMIPSTVSQVEYIVTTVCCDPNVNTATNCASYALYLGKSVPLIKACDKFSGTVCDSKPMVTAAGCVVPFSKALTYPVGTQINYTQGCEGEYTMCINNNGNMPLTSLNLTDFFPAGIDVTKICIISSGGVNMNYNIIVAFTSGVPINSNGIVNTNPCYNFSTPQIPISMTFQTTSGSLTYGTICIKVRYKITASVGTLIHNCATLNYTGNYNGTASLCGFVFPPCTGTVNSCADFTVETQKAIPGLTKCINGPQSYPVGSTIPFCITISNHGSASLNGYTLNDLLNSAQNLELVNGSVTYEFGSSNYNGYTPCCPNVGSSSSSPPTWVTPNLTNILNPTWTINGMPGDCRFDFASYLVIKFNAVVKPQNYGQYTNHASLSGGGNTLTSPAPYNVVRIAEIKTTKLVNNGPGQAFASSGYVNPGGSFQYMFRIENIGSVGLKNLRLVDALPSCVQFTCPGVPMISKIYNSSGVNISSANVTCSTISGITTLSLNPATTSLSPGNYVDIIVNVIRLGNTPEPCCNKEATGYGTVTDVGGQTIQDSDGPVCVQRSICCDMEEVFIQQSPLNPPTSGNYWNFGLTIYASNLPIQEVDISVMDYHFTYQNIACKPPNVGNYLGHLWTTTPNIGAGLNLTNPNTMTNNLLNWQAGTPVMFTGGQFFKLHISRPMMLPLNCCKGTFYYCLKIRLKDVKCRICEKIICFSEPMGSLFFPLETQQQFDIFENDFPESDGN